MKKLQLITTVFLFLGLFSCTLEIPPLTTESVTFILPEYPPAETPQNYPPLSHWKIKLQYADSVKEFSTTATSFSIDTKKNIPFSVTAYPVTILKNGEITQFFKPAGTIYPYEYNPKIKSQKLSWEQGFSAHILNCIFKSKEQTFLSTRQINNFVMGFNWKKFMETVTQEQNKSFVEFINNPAEKKYFTPWQVNTETLLENLSQGKFSASLLKPKYQFIIQCPVSKPEPLSSYIPENHLINSFNKITLTKNKSEMLMYENTMGLFLSGTSAKNLSLQWIIMPILKESYEES